MTETPDTSETDELSKAQKAANAQFDFLEGTARILTELDEEFTVVRSGGTYTLECKNRPYMNTKAATNRTSIAAKDLSFIKQVKRYVRNSEACAKYYNAIDSADIKYIAVNSDYYSQTLEDKVIEIDIDEAYWKAAHLLGIIDDEIYEKGRKGVASKNTRLIALGSLAKKIVTYKFHGNKLIKTHSELAEPRTAPCWFMICDYVAKVLDEVRQELGNDFVFYWVDGAYVINKKKNIAAVKRIFKKYNFEMKTEPIHKVVFTDKDFKVWNKKGDDPREFGYVTQIDRASHRAMSAAIKKRKGGEFDKALDKYEVKKQT